MKLLPNGFEISAADKAALENDVPDGSQWLTEAAVAKIATCRKRLIQTELPKLTNDKTIKTLPIGDEDELILFIVSRPGYQNRATRYAAEQERLKAGFEAAQQEQ